MKTLRLTLTLLLALTACSDRVLLLSERTETLIGPAGGVAHSAGGEMSLTFSPGSLSQEETITIETLRGRQVPRLRSLVFELGPEGRKFDAPVTIRIAASLEEEGEELAVANVDAYPEIVEGSVFDATTGQASAQLEHFSAWAVVAVYNPCGGLACGDACTLCDPMDPGCTEPPPAAKSCNRSGLCVESSIAMCPMPVDGGTPDTGMDPDSGVDVDAGEDDGGPADTGVVACTDTFQQNAQPVVDLLIVMDNSCSMSEEQTALATSFDLLLNTLTGNNVDFQIGVTTTDVEMGGEQGQLVGTPPILTSSTPNLAQAFATAVNVGTDGSAFEQGLEASMLALTPPMITGPNAGFLRNAGSLTVIYVSDEDDYSPTSTATYSQFLLGLGGPRRVQANAIVGPNPGGCATATYGQRYDLIRIATGGAFDEICTPPWSGSLTDLGGPGFGYLYEFQLALPAPNIISVMVNGVALPEQGNWSYDAATRTLSFALDAVPPPDATIVVESGC